MILTGENGQGEGPLSKKPDGQPVNIDGLAAAFGAASKAGPWDLREVSAFRATELYSDYVDTKKDDIVKKNEAPESSELTTTVIAKNNSFSEGAGINNVGAALMSSEKKVRAKSNIQIGQSFYYQSIGQNRVKVSDSTARLWTPSDGPVKDTVKPGQGF